MGDSVRSSDDLNQQTGNKTEHPSVRVGGVDIFYFQQFCSSQFRLDFAPRTVRTAHSQSSQIEWPGYNTLAAAGSLSGCGWTWCRCHDSARHVRDGVGCSGLTRGGRARVLRALLVAGCARANTRVASMMGRCLPFPLHG